MIITPSGVSMLFILFLLIPKVTGLPTSVLRVDTTSILYYFGTLGSPCRLNIQCELVRNARCLKGECACRAGYTSNGRFRCIPRTSTTLKTTTSTIIYDSAIGSPCQSNINCQRLINNAICLHGRCACETGYTPGGLFKCVLKGGLTPTPTSTTSTFIYDSAIGSPCQSNINCQGLINNAICSDGQCACEAGYTPDGLFKCILTNGLTLTPTSTTSTLICDIGIGDTCQADTDCQGLINNAICSDGQCSCEAGYTPNGLFKCVLTGGMSPTATSTPSTPIYDSAIGSPCQSNINCQGLISNAICLDGQCTCEAGYTPDGLFKCVLKDGLTPTPTSTTTSFFADSAIGGHCQSNINCQGLINNAICLDGQCACEAGYTPDGLFKCILTNGLTLTPTSTTSTLIYDIGIGDPCQTDTNCQDFINNAICSDGQCACEAGYTLNGLFKCVLTGGMSPTATSTPSTPIYDSAIGSPCQSNINCQGLISNAICLDGQCTCEAGYSPDGLFKCVLKDGLTQTATSTATTTPVYDSVINGSCESDTNCQGLVNNAICLDGICACETGYTPNGVHECISSEGQ